MELYPGESFGVDSRSLTPAFCECFHKASFESGGTTSSKYLSIFFLLNPGQQNVFNFKAKAGVGVIPISNMWECEGVVIVDTMAINARIVTRNLPVKVADVILAFALSYCNCFGSLGEIL